MIATRTDLFEQLGAITNHPGEVAYESPVPGIGGLPELDDFRAGGSTADVAMPTVAQPDNDLVDLLDSTLLVGSTDSIRRRTDSERSLRLQAEAAEQEEAT